MAKAFVTLFITLCLLLSAQATSNCVEEDTHHDSITPHSDEFHYEALDSIADFILLTYGASYDDQIHVTVHACSNTTGEVHSLTYSLDSGNTTGIASFNIGKIIETSTTGNDHGSTTGHESSTTNANQGSTGSQSTTGNNNDQASTTGNNGKASTTGNNGKASTTGNNNGQGSTTGAPASTTSTSGRLEISSALRAASPSMLFIVLAAVVSIFSPKSRFGLLMCVVIVLAMNAQAVDNSVSPSFHTKISVHIHIPSSIKKICIRGNCFRTDNNGTVTDYISLFGKRYALMSGQECNTTKVLALPAGWNIASNTDSTQLVILLNKWTTFALVLVDGKSYYNGKNNSVWRDSGFSLAVDAFGVGKNGYKVSTCDSDILIEQDCHIEDPTYSIVSPPLINPDNIITLFAHDYAVVGNVKYSDNSAGCDGSVYLDSSSEWELAPEEPASRMVIQAIDGRSWGTDCVVLANGNALRSDLSVCISDQLTTTPYHNGHIYSLKSCNKRILLRRASSKPDTWPTTTTITNLHLFGGAQYASLDNADPLTGGSSCQYHYRAVPAGWSLASSLELSEFFASVGYSAWQSTYCWVTDGFSITPAGVACNSTLYAEHIGETNYYATKFCGRILLKRAIDIKSNFTLGMKVLLLSASDNTTADVGIELAKTVFTALGVPYDHVALINSATGGPTCVGELPLYDSHHNPAYYAIVLTDSQLVYKGEVSITVDQQSQLDLYKLSYNVRLVALSSYPNPRLPGVIVNSIMPINDTHLAFDKTFTTKASKYVAGLNPNATFDLHRIYAVSVNITNSEKVSPVMHYFCNDDNCLFHDEPVAAGIFNMTDGTEELHFFFGQSTTTTHGPFLGSLWLNWITRGLWIGARRTFLLPQIDDLFLGTEEYNNIDVVNRMTATDLEKTNDYFRNVLVNYAPHGSNITCEFGYNGKAVDPKVKATNAQDNLFIGVRTHVEDFFWESHSYSHLDFTCPDSNCTQYGNTTYTQVWEENAFNINFTRNYLLKDLDGLNNHFYSPNCMITPKITGLFNPAAIKAMLDNGVKCVVGDNSIKKLIPNNLYHGLVTTTEYNGYPGLFIIPRFPTEIYFDVATPEVQVEQFNARYGIVGKIVPQDKDFTLDEILLQEAQRTTRNLLLFRHDPYMFHQANVVHFPYTKAGDSAEKEWSLLTLWVASVVDMYVQYMTFPMITTRHQDLWGVYEARMARDVCGISGQLTVVNGVTTEVHLSATGECEAVVTGLKACGGASDCRVEEYGPDSSVWSQMEPGQHVDLPATVQWA